MPEAPTEGRDPLHESQAPTWPASTDHLIGQVVGHFHVLERLGEGGFGIVYVAEQRSPVRRKVALKLLKPGVASREVLARFDAERQALAMMDHANVAKVFEAGITPDGRPYFAMEYVPGVPLTDYADSSYLSTKDRLRLFIPVCHAVQHAHQKGIIHRDLKPSNVLVMLVDGQPVPKVIDFGIAKALHTPLTEHTLHTIAGRLMGTPEYTSPEQAASGGLDVDTRTDVYSLGVILYQLLTGTLPFESERLRSAGVDAMIRTIREMEPPKPSTRLSTLMTQAAGPGGASAQSIARQRRASPKAIARELAGDLDWITLKAMEKDRARRYQSATELAADLQRHLDHEPVSAGPPGLFYRLGKFARRHRAAVAAGLAAGLVLFASVIVIGFLLAEAVQARDEARGATAEASRERDVARHNEREANVQRAEALAAREDSEAVSSLLLNIIGSTNLARNALARDRSMSEVVDDIVRALDRGEPRVKPGQEVRIRSTIARAYQSQGRFSQAKAQGQTALALAEKYLPPDSPMLAQALLALAWPTYRLEEDAWPLVERASRLEAVRSPALRDSFRLLAGHTAKTTEQRRAYYSEGLLVAEAENDPAGRMLYGGALGILASDTGDPAEAERLLLKYCRNARGDFDESDANFPVYLSRLGRVVRDQGRQAEALPYLRRALAWNLAHLPREHPDIAREYRAVRECLVSLHDADAINALDTELYNYILDVLRSADSFADVNATEIARVWAAEWQLDRALVVYRAVLERRVRQLPADHGWIAGSRGDVAQTLILMGRAEEALPLLDAADASFGAAGNHDALDWTYRLRLDALIALGRLDAALALVDQRRADRLTRLGAQSEQLSWSDAERALVLVTAKRYAEAEPIVRSLLAGIKDPKSWGYFDTLSLMGACAAGQGRDADARRDLTAAAQGLLDSPDGLPLRKLQALDRVIAYCQAKGDGAGETTWRRARERLLTPSYKRP